jgi:hypothetical protein
VLLGRVVLESRNRFSMLYSGRIPQGAAVAIGSSRGVNAFDPAALSSVLGVPCFNLSYNGMSLQVAEVVLRDLVERGGRPSLVLIEVTAVNSDLGLLNELRPYEAWSPRLADLDARSWPRPHAASRISRLYAFNGELFFRSLYYLRRSDQAWFNNHVMSEEAYASQRGAPAITLRTAEAEFRSLGSLVRWMGERRIPVRLVVGPYLPEYRARLVNYGAWLERLRQEAGEVPIADLSLAVPERSCFADELHLNAEGTAAFTRILASSSMLQVSRSHE